MGIVHETSFESPENLRIRLVAMPENMNYRGDAFGGWLLAQNKLTPGTHQDITSYARSLSPTLG